MKVVSTSNAPAAIGPYSQAIDLGNMVFVSGQIPVDPATGKMADTVEEQAAQSLANLKAILAEAGLSLPAAACRWPPSPRAQSWRSSASPCANDQA